MVGKCERKKIKESMLPKEIQELFKKAGREDPTTIKYKKGTAVWAHVMLALFDCSRDEKLTLWEQLEILIYTFQYARGGECEYAIPPEYTIYGLLDDSYEGEEELLNEPKTWQEYYHENFQNKDQLPLKFIKDFLDTVAYDMSDQIFARSISGHQTDFKAIKEDFEFLWDIYINHLPAQKGKKLIALSAKEISDVYGFDNKDRYFITLDKAIMYRSVLTKFKEFIQKRDITEEQTKKKLLLGFLYMKKHKPFKGFPRYGIDRLLEEILETEESPRVAEAKKNLLTMRKM